jgi:hypothetical protein
MPFETTDTALAAEIAAKFTELHAKLKKPKVTLAVYSSRHFASTVKLREFIIQ